VLIEKYYSRLTLDFHVNKKLVGEVAIIPSKRMRNKIAGFVTHLMKRIQRGPVRGISLKLQEEERERRLDFVPEVCNIFVYCIYDVFFVHFVLVANLIYYIYVLYIYIASFYFYYYILTFTMIYFLYRNLPLSRTLSLLMRTPRICLSLWVSRISRALKPPPPSLVAEHKYMLL
jgi:ribosomal protein S17E